MARPYLTPRELVLEIIFKALDAATEGDAFYDTAHEATTLLDEIERRAISVDVDGPLLFLNAEMKPEFS